MPNLLRAALFFLVGVLAASAAGAAGRDRLAVLGLRANGVESTATQSLSGILNTEITRLERYEVVGEEDVRNLVAAAQLAQALGCEGASCAADLTGIGQQLDAGLLVAGTVGKVGDSSVLNLTLLDPRKSKPINRTSTTAKTLDELAGGMRAAVLALFGIAGQLVLWNQPDGAQVFLNERLVGTAPVKKIDLPREGEYQVRVYRDDATPFDAMVSVKAGEMVRLRVESFTFRDLEEWSADRRRLGTGLVIGGAVVLGSAAALFVVAAQNDSLLDGLDARKPEDVTRGKEIASTSAGYVLAASAAGVLGLGLAGTGTYLVLANPWQAHLDRVTVVPRAGGALLALSGSF